METTGNNICVQNLSVTFKGRQPFHAVKGVSFEINAGETLTLIGRSGSGKSVTSLALMGLLPRNTITRGTFTIGNGNNLLELPAEDWHSIRGKDIAMVFQEPMSALNPIRTCGDQLVESILAHQDISKKTALQKARDWFEKVKLPDPEEIINRYPHQLSGGQKQRVMIAMAMCNHPKLLIADEPTTALDVTVQQEVIELMNALQKEYKTALLFITHDLRLAEKIADNIIVMQHGVLVNERLQRKDWKREKHEDPKEETILLQAENVKVYYEDKKGWLGKTAHIFKAVDDVSFRIAEGATLGLVGESGCGKSTLSRTILGLQQITSGKIFFDGKDITNYSRRQWRALSKDIQIIFQDPYASLNPRIRIGDALMEPVKIHRIAKGKAAQDIVMELLSNVQLPGDAFNKYPHEFSGGQRQRLCIARALAVHPRLIICDESVSALDVDTQEQILALLKALQQQKQLTYLFISHDLNIVKAITDDILIMQQGKIVERGKTALVMSHPQNDYTKKLLAVSL